LSKMKLDGQKSKNGWFKIKSAFVWLHIFLYGFK
jgi:hypothetical protein